MNKIWVIIRKEWRDVFKDKIIVSTSLLLPLIFIAMPVVMIYFMERTPPTSSGGMPSGFNAPSGFENLLRMPQFAGLDPLTVFEIILLDQFLLYFLMIPLMIPLFVAVYSIIGEKQQRSLEPLLATPISVWQLLLAKTLAGVIPAIIVTWISYVITALGVALVARPVVASVMWTSRWLLALGILAPLLTITAVTVAVIISSRVNDVRMAEQLGGLLVLPLVGLSVPILMGRLLVTTELFAIVALGVALLDIALMYVGVKLFQRETILIRWSH